MTGLLVSVRSAEEARTALTGGADVVDVKEPRRGALGAADPEVWRGIQAVVGSQAIVSAALGELADESIEMLAAQAVGFRYAKVGLAGCAGRDWLGKWSRVVGALPRGVGAVPVAYADLHGGSSMMEAAIRLAAQSQSRMLLIDTFDKSGGRLLEHLGIESLLSIGCRAEKMGAQLALAGSLQEEDISRLVEVAPAYVGVRGAACQGGRDGTIDLARVKSLAAFVHRASQKIAS